MINCLKCNKPINEEEDSFIQLEVIKTHVLENYHLDCWNPNRDKVYCTDPRVSLFDFNKYKLINLSIGYSMEYIIKNNKVEPLGKTVK